MSSTPYYSLNPWTLLMRRTFVGWFFTAIFCGDWLSLCAGAFSESAHDPSSPWFSPRIAWLQVDSTEKITWIRRFLIFACCRWCSFYDSTRNHTYMPGYMNIKLILQRKSLGSLDFWFLVFGFFGLPLQNLILQFYRKSHIYTKIF